RFFGNEIGTDFVLRLLEFLRAGLFRFVKTSDEPLSFSHRERFGERRKRIGRFRELEQEIHDSPLVGRSPKLKVQLFRNGGPGEHFRRFYLPAVLSGVFVEILAFAVAQFVEEKVNLFRELVVQAALFLSQRGFRGALLLLGRLFLLFGGVFRKDFFLHLGLGNAGARENPGNLDLLLGKVLLLGGFPVGLELVVGRLEGVSIFPD